ASIANGNFKNTGSTFGKFDGNFRFNFEALANKRDALQQIGANHLVAGFHIGEIQIRDDVAHKGQKSISKLVTEEKDAPVFAGKKAGAENGVGLFFQENLDHFKEIQRVIFEIGVMNNGELRVR